MTNYYYYYYLIHSHAWNRRRIRCTRIYTHCSLSKGCDCVWNYGNNLGAQKNRNILLKLPFFPLTYNAASSSSSSWNMFWCIRAKMEKKVAKHFTRGAHHSQNRMCARTSERKWLPWSYKEKKRKKNCAGCFYYFSQQGISSQVNWLLLRFMRSLPAHRYTKL